MHCEYCKSGSATEKVKVQRRGEEGYRTLMLCEDCREKIGKGDLSVLDMDTPSSDRAVSVAISKSDTHLRIEIEAPRRSETENLTDEEFASALLGFVARQIAGEAAEKRGKDN